MTSTHRYILAAALFALTGAAQALTFTARASTHTLPGGPDDAKQAGGRTPVSVSASNQGFSDGTGGPISVGALAQASADRGGVHLFAQTFSDVQSSGRFDIASAQAKASGSVGDNFVITSATPLTSGTAIAVDVGFWVSGNQLGEASSAGTNAQSWSSWSGRLRVNDQDGQLLEANMSNECYTDETRTTLNCLGSGGGLQWSTLTFIVDRNYSWGVQGDVSSSILSAHLSKSLSQVDLSHTLAWGGMRNFRDLQGNALTGIHAWSTDGSFDYVDAFASVPPPVPEPGSGAMLLVGLAVLARLMGRCRA